LGHFRAIWGPQGRIGGNLGEILGKFGGPKVKFWGNLRLSGQGLGSPRQNLGHFRAILGSPRQNLGHFREILGKFGVPKVKFGHFGEI